MGARAWVRAVLTPHEAWGVTDGWPPMESYDGVEPDDTRVCLILNWGHVEFDQDAESVYLSLSPEDAGKLADALRAQLKGRP